MRELIKYYPKGIIFYNDKKWKILSKDSNEKSVTFNTYFVRTYKGTTTFFGNDKDSALNFFNSICYFKDKIINTCGNNF